MAVPPDARPVARPAIRVLACVGLLLASAASAAPASAVRPDLAKPISGTRCSEFPADNWWHADVSEPAGARAQRRRGSRTCRPTSTCTRTSGRPTATAPYGIPITVVGGKHAKVEGVLRLRRGERPGALPARQGHQDRGRPGLRRRPARDRRRQGAPAGSTRPARPASNGRWHAGSGAIWSLKSNKLRPDGWTSADAAGLPILPGLLRWNEVKRTGSTTPSGSRPTRPAAATCGRPATTPARSNSWTTRRWAPGSGSRGLRRLRSVAARQSVVAAMKKYGLVLADNGSPWYLPGRAERASGPTSWSRTSRRSRPRRSSPWTPRRCRCRRTPPRCADLLPDSGLSRSLR